MRRTPGYAAVPNLSWKDAAGVIQHNALAPWITDLDALPVPDFSLAGGTADCVIGGKRTVMVQTSRGCPFDCSFCSVTGMFGKKFRYRSVEAILKELRRYDTRNHFVFFCDDNFTANKRRARELLRGDDRRRIPLPVVHAGAHRSGPRSRSRAPDETRGLPYGVHRLRIGESPKPRRR